MESVSWECYASRSISIDPLLPVVLIIVCHGIPQWQAEPGAAPQLAQDEGLSSPERGDFITKHS
ncbi:hypothetical protein NDS46_03485 [Paenibacillus thiaminolyticus]|uniref:hypothetical protein n=1 Tax=Paenibacillus thiaminolyticus TaxID=49283 RepID=UPI00232DFEF7|nr:hypothetical protein [Paenibacillus thiaminolyticus]WCF08984.1 hypothetical protein NDS46_03485 [Paenibacillus thiaminolyticus]